MMNKIEEVTLLSRFVQELKDELTEEQRSYIETLNLEQIKSDAVATFNLVIQPEINDIMESH